LAKAIGEAMLIVKMPANSLIPKEDANFVDTGILSLIEKIAWGDALILKGPKGSGKTLAIEQWCGIHGIPMVRENCNSGTDETQLIGSFGMEGNNVHFTLGALPLAIETANTHGEAVLVLEEINTLRPQVQSMVFSVADYRKAVECASLGRKFELNKDALLWVIGTMNPGYAGTYQLNEALRSRFDFIEVGYMPQLKEKELLERSFSTPADVEQRRIVARLLTFAEESRTYEWEYALSTRDLVQSIRKIERIGLGKALKMLVQKFDPEHKEKIEARVQSMFGVNLQEVTLYGTV
jgi:MoxR-like ATPase